MVLVHARHEEYSQRQVGVFGHVSHIAYRLLSVLSRIGALRLLLSLKPELSARGMLKHYPEEARALFPFLMGNPTLYDTAVAELNSVREMDAQLAEAGEELWQSWQEAQLKLAALSTQGKQVIVEDSSHAIPLLRPDAVVDAIREVVETVKAH